MRNNFFAFSAFIHFFAIYRNFSLFSHHVHFRFSPAFFALFRKNFCFLRSFIFAGKFVHFCCKRTAKILQFQMMEGRAGVANVHSSSLALCTFLMHFSNSFFPYSCANIFDSLKIKFPTFFSASAEQKVYNFC